MNEDDFYWTDDGGSIWTARVDGGPATTVVSSATLGGSAYIGFFDGSTLYYVAELGTGVNMAQSEIHSLTLGVSGADTVIYSSPGSIGNLLHSGSDVCYEFNDNAPSAIRCAPLDAPGAVREVVAGTLGIDISPLAVAADDTAVYWIANGGIVAGQVNISVMRIVK